MEGGPAAWANSICTNQQVDPDPFDEGPIRPQAFDYDDTPLQPIERLRMNQNGAARIAESHERTVGKPLRLAVVWMDERRRPPLTVLTGRRFSEAGIKEVTRWSGNKPVRVKVVSLFDRVIVTGHSRHTFRHPTDISPISLEVEFPIRMAKPLQKMALFKLWREVSPAFGMQGLGIGQTRIAQGSVDYLPIGQLKTRVIAPKPFRQTAQHCMVRPALTERFNYCFGNEQMCVAASNIKIFMF